jgi:hypothetical protein
MSVALNHLEKHDLLLTLGSIRLLFSFLFLTLRLLFSYLGYWVELAQAIEDFLPL